MVGSLLSVLIGAHSSLHRAYEIISKILPEQTSKQLFHINIPPWSSLFPWRTPSFRFPSLDTQHSTSRPCFSPETTNATTESFPSILVKNQSLSAKSTRNCAAMILLITSLPFSLTQMRPSFNLDLNLDLDLSLTPNNQVT